MSISLKKNKPMPSSNDVMGMQQNTFCMLLHLSQLLLFCLGPVALAVPVVLWAINKDANPVVDRHGKMILNWLITFAIGLGIIIGFCFVFIGFLLIPLLFGAFIFFAVYGGIQAHKGNFWSYAIGKFNCYYTFIK